MATYLLLDIGLYNWPITKMCWSQDTQYAINADPWLDVSFMTARENRKYLHFRASKTPTRCLPHLAAHVVRHYGIARP